MKMHAGFTLVELLITIVIATILVALTVPAFHTFVQNNRITAQVNELVTALTLTRSEAVKRKQTVSICSSSDVSTCTGNWNQGWIIFTDDNSNGAVDAGTDVVLRVWEGLAGGATLTETAAGATFIRFDRLGSANISANFELRIPDCKGNQARDILLLVTGRTSVSQVNCP
jgi:type IV fimbrial biogenesis protein FimT